MFNFLLFWWTFITNIYVERDIQGYFEMQQNFVNLTEHGFLSFKGADFRVHIANLVIVSSEDYLKTENLVMNVTKIQSSKKCWENLQDLAELTLGC